MIRRSDRAQVRESDVRRTLEVLRQGQEPGGSDPDWGSGKIWRFCSRSSWEVAKLA